MSAPNWSGGFGVGVDLGPLFGSDSLASPARQLGARWARVHIDLAGFPEPDDEFVKRGLHALQALGDAGLRVVAALGPDLTVAPGGLGSFEDPPAGALHEAWDLEWAGNLERLARAFGDHVAAWELLPDPTHPRAPVAPRRWAHHIVAGAAAIRRGAPQAVVLPGAIAADGQDEPDRFLTAALDAAAADAWRGASLGGLSLAFRVLPRAAADEEQVIAAVRTAAEAAAAVAALLGVGGAPGLALVSWSATECGEDDQGRNLWASFNTLSSHGHAGPVIWRCLLDSGDGRGLYRGAAAEDDQRRPAWAAFSDFALYAAQIAPAFTANDWALPAAPEVVPEPTGEVVRPEPTGEVVRLRVPPAEELLRAQGIGGRRLEAALAVLAARHPFALQSGEYDLPLPADLDMGPVYTNQDVISAFYRVGGGTWDVLERAGIELRDLTADRNAAYGGVSLEELSALSDDERTAVLGELERLKSEPAIR